MAIQNTTYHEGGIWHPHFQEGDVIPGRSLIVPIERAIVVSYRLSIMTTALSPTIRSQFANECLRCSNQ